MSGGISAIRGFDYQATVILDLLFDHFEHHGPSASARPEGEDDLDLRWTEAGVDHRRFVQVKKPTEDAQAVPNPSPWSLADIARDLLPDAVARLTGNDHEQIWVLGDVLATPVRELFDAGAKAPHEITNSYWTLIHSLARAEARILLPAGLTVAKATSQWRVPGYLSTDAQQAQSALAEAANAFGQLHGPEGTVFAHRYAQEVARLHALMPGVLGRIQILDANGAEIEVAERVMTRLEQLYGLKRSVIENTLFRNLRGFINDMSKQPGRSFDHEELEMELRSVWPHMVPIKTPPPLADDHIMRPVVAANLTDPWTGVAVEVIGISGSGKTLLAAEILKRSRLIHPDRIALYAEVRTDVSLRDCLVGTAFHLRRLGLSEPFGVAIQPDQADEGVLAALAKAFSKIPREFLLLLDLVEGSEPPGFARNLATFIRALPPNTLRLIVFGQESSLRQLTTLEQTQLGVRSVDAPGLNFEEFVTLVGRRHSKPDRAQLSSLYQQMTVGRSAGLNISLAQALARAQTMAEMSAFVALPAEDRLEHAERSRFARVSSSARAAAEKLTCFALPFRRPEAEGVFPGDNVGLAVRELLDLGLLRRHDAESYEMHETVRAGLEELIAPQTRRDAHNALACWYQDSAQIGAAIFHFEQAGQSQEAQAQARKTFLAGESWKSLWLYVTRHRLVSAIEVVTVIAGPGHIEDAYLLPDILKELKDPGSTEALMCLLREQFDRALTDHQWARQILGAILGNEPSRLDDLIEFVIQAGSSPEAVANSLPWLSIAAHRWSGAIGPSTLALFDRQPEAIQKPLLGLMLRGGRAALRHAFQHLYKHPEWLESGKGAWPLFNLNVRNSEEIADILVALPMAPQIDIIVSRSPQLGPVGRLIWAVRKELRTPCIAVLQAQVLESDALVNAIRILLFLGEPTILDLCEGLRGRSDTASSFADHVPAMIPALADWDPYESRVLDQAAEFSDRGLALITLACSGTRRLDNLLDRLRAADIANWPRWAATLQIIASRTLFAAAIPILSEALAPGAKASGWLPSIISRQGQTAGPDVTDVLFQALHHGDMWVRKSAAEALAHRRDRSALPQLIERYGQESVPVVQVELAAAIVASGATSTADLATRSSTPDTDLWWCVLAHRTRDSSAAERLVSIGIDPTQLWQVRRAAIAAAGRLPYEAALARIELSVMAGRSPLIPAFDQMANGRDVLLLQASVLRALRLYGRQDRIEAHLAAADNVWLATRALVELSKLAKRGSELGQRLRNLISGATWIDNWAVNNLLNDLAKSPVTNIGSGLAAAHEVATSQLANPPFTYEAALRFLSGGQVSLLSDGPLVLEPLTAEECETLIRLADPAKDPERGETVFTSAVSFTKEGYQVSQRLTTIGGEAFLPDRLRPAVAAANKFGLPMPWHTSRLEAPLSESYVSDFLECLAAQRDDAHFYAALAEAQETLMPRLCQKAYELSPLLKIDSRLIPTLTRFLTVGGDDLFKGMCILAKNIDIPEIVPVLEGLLHRWAQRFDLQALKPQNNDEAFDLWHGFARLSEHPRFEDIPDWPQQLEAVLMTPMAWHRAQSIVRVLERNSGSYSLIEARLLREVNWEHYHEDEVDRLDRAAEALFIFPAIG